jgi:7-cyano-7-deazaguanine synthase in queuosine biosynthesis
MVADQAQPRCESPDGWTREFELKIAVEDAPFWNTQANALEAALAFLTTDRWALEFVEGGDVPAIPARPVYPPEDAVVLLSGGLDSLIGAIDLAGAGTAAIAVSHVVRGDAARQVRFAESIGGGLRHVQLNHNAKGGGAEDASQRARSIIFLAYGVLTGTSLERHHCGNRVPLYVCENGFIGVNPPLTGARIGSLSTRTAHPIFLGRMQQVLDAAGLRVGIENPYRAMTKGEMLASCTDQTLLRREAVNSTSCGRFQRYSYRHCGRCIPCQIRRAAFLRWGVKDSTEYVFDNLGKKHPDYNGFDDVRAAAMAIREVAASGLDSWLGPALGSPFVEEADKLRAMVQRGLDELAALHRAYAVK